MEMRLLDNKGDFITEFKFSRKEINTVAYMATRMVAKEVYRESSRYIYFRIKGDFLNNR